MPYDRLTISCDSHILEVPEIFDGLDKRFGDAAPGIVHDPEKGEVLSLGTGKTFIVSIGRFGIAGHFANDPETQEMIKQGYRACDPASSTRWSGSRTRTWTASTPRCCCRASCSASTRSTTPTSSPRRTRTTTTGSTTTPRRRPSASVPDRLHPDARHRPRDRGAAPRQEDGTRRRQHPLRPADGPPVLGPRTTTASGRPPRSSDAAGHALPHLGAAQPRPAGHGDR